MTVAEVLAEVLKDRIFYDDSGGGVTFSGGEPLSHPGFVGRLARRLKRRGRIAIVQRGRIVADGTLDEIRRSAPDLGEAADLEDLFLRVTDPDGRA